MSDRKTFENSVTPLPEELGITPNGMMVNATSDEHRDQTMTLLFSLETPPSALEELEAKVARGEVVPPEELQQRYGPKQADVEKLKNWLESQGYKITNVSPDNTGIYAQASVGKMSETLGVNMVRVTRDGITYKAAQNAPSLPSEVGNSVHAIIGLQPFRRAHKHSRMHLPSSGNRVSSADAAPAGPSTNIQNAPPYLVAELLKAYSANGLGVTGSGQTIAILIDTVPKTSDLQTFGQRNNVPPTLQQITIINVQGRALPPPQGAE